MLRIGQAPTWQVPTGQVAHVFDVLGEPVLDMQELRGTDESMLQNKSWLNTEQGIKQVGNRTEAWFHADYSYHIQGEYTEPDTLIEIVIESTCPQLSGFSDIVRIFMAQLSVNLSGRDGGNIITDGPHFHKFMNKYIFEHVEELFAQQKNIKTLTIRMGHFRGLSFSWRGNSKIPHRPSRRLPSGGIHLITQQTSDILDLNLGVMGNQKVRR